MLSTTAHSGLTWNLYTQESRSTEILQKKSLLIFMLVLTLEIRSKKIMYL